MSGKSVASILTALNSIMVNENAAVSLFGRLCLGFSACGIYRLIERAVGEKVLRSALWNLEGGRSDINDFCNS